MVCPKCKTPIKWNDLAPNCKICGAHILYYTQEEDLARDAKKTELEFASARRLVARFKAAFIAGKLQIARMVCMVLCIGALVVPYANFAFSFPLLQSRVGVGGIGLYSLITESVYRYLFLLPQAGLADEAAGLALASLLLYVLVVLLVAAAFLTWLLSFTDIRRSAVALCCLSALAILGNAGSVILAFVLRTQAQALPFLSVSIGAGAFLSIATLIGFIIINLLFLRADIQPVIKESDKERLAIAARIKAGELSLEDLPMPIIETEEERNARINALAAAQKKKKKKFEAEEGHRT